jgi:hypothetical protein
MRLPVRVRMMTTIEERAGGAFTRNKPDDQPNIYKKRDKYFLAF